jgi:hypothetical protein
MMKNGDKDRLWHLLEGSQRYVRLVVLTVLTEPRIFLVHSFSSAWSHGLES